MALRSPFSLRQAQVVGEACVILQALCWLRQHQQACHFFSFYLSDFRIVLTTLFSPPSFFYLKLYGTSGRKCLYLHLCYHAAKGFWILVSSYPSPPLFSFFGPEPYCFISILQHTGPLGIYWRTLLQWSQLFVQFFIPLELAESRILRAASAVIRRKTPFISFCAVQLWTLRRSLFGESIPFSSSDPGPGELVGL